MINGLSVNDVDDLWKYVDDSTLSESVPKESPSNFIQRYVDGFNEKSTTEGFQINEPKCKEIRILSFAQCSQDFQPIILSTKKCRNCNIVKIAGSNHLR
jgi:hypothetical protein